MGSPAKSILLVLVCTIFTSAAQLLYKAGSARLSWNVMGLLTNRQIILGLCLYGIGAIILIKALKGADLSLLYPVIATSYIWVTLFSFLLFNEVFNIYKILGVIAIISGVVLMGIGSKSSVQAFTDGVS